ncbi:MAG: hypothetical protein J1F38_01290 [Muribaculaceae bacterium]|nr:hypothetical protein [Muribaculaceae bacterium]
MKYLRDIKYLIGVLAFSTMSVASLTSCKDELKLDYGTIELGDKVEGKLNVNVQLPGASQRTRNVDFSNSAVIKVDSYWVGVYDTYTGELLGYRLETEPRKEGGSRYTINGTTGVFNVEDVEIYYYQKHPEVYVVGVVNLNNVKGKIAGSSNELSDLSTLLSNATKWEDFCKISVDTQSIENAVTETTDGINQMPLLMGYYSTAGTGLHPTVSSWDNYSVSTDDVRVRISDGNNGLKLDDGSVKLKRLVSEITVHVGGLETMESLMDQLNKLYPGILPEYYTRSTGQNAIKEKLSENSETRAIVEPSMPDLQEVKISNLYYKVLNNPKSVYLAEHTTDRNAYKRTQQDFANYSPNSADYDGAVGYESIDEWIPVNGNTFTYQAYENKHWGNTDWLDEYIHKYYIDEPNFDDLYWSMEYYQYKRKLLMYDSFPLRSKTYHWENNTLRMLCPTPAEDWNNYAPTFAIKADVQFVYPDNVSPGRYPTSATLEFIINEGFSSMADGSAFWETMKKITPPNGSSATIQEALETMKKMVEASENLISDYQRSRNTKYNYYLSIVGAEMLMANVIPYEYDEEHPLEDQHIDGMTGTANYYMPEKLGGEGSYSYYWGDEYALIEYDKDTFLALWEGRSNMKWRYLVHGPGTEQNYGNWSIEDNIPELPPINSPIQTSNYPDVLNDIKIVVVRNGDLQPYPNEDSPGNIEGEVEKEWTLEEFIKETEELDMRDFYNNCYFGIYIPEFKTDVPYSQIDEVYRNLYIQVFDYTGYDNKTRVRHMLGFEQVPYDSRIDISQDYQYYNRFRPYFDIDCSIHHPFMDSYSYKNVYKQWTSAPGVIHYICWDASAFKEADLNVDHFELYICDSEPVIVETSKYMDENGHVHYPYYVPYNLKEYRSYDIGIRPVGFTNIKDGEVADFKATEPFNDIESLDVLTSKPHWSFDNWYKGTYNNPWWVSNFENYSYDGSAGLEMFGLTLQPDMTANFWPDDSDRKNTDYRSYIITNGSGNISRRSFTVTIDRPGTFKIDCSLTGANNIDDTRNVMLYNSRTGSLVEQTLTNPSNQQKIYELHTKDVNFGEVTTMGIWGSKSLRFYGIEFVPD